jgi:hypothetical protein
LTPLGVVPAGQVQPALSWAWAGDAYIKNKIATAAAILKMALNEVT